MAFRYDEQSDADKELVDKVRKTKEFCEPYQQRWREQAERRYALYRSFQAFKSDWRSLAPPDKDDFWQQSRRTFGEPLFIPHCFATVETTVPRMLSERPRMLVLPRTGDSEENVIPVRNTIDAQQAQIHYELVLQDIAKTGLIYGLGVEKVYWKFMKTKRRYLRPATAPTAEGADWVEDQEERVVFDDPDAIWVDPFDFFWDPFGWDMKTVEYVIHRTWRSKKYVKDRVESKQWRNLDTSDLEELEPANQGEYDKLTQARLEARGYGDISRRSNQLHEVWEYHDGEEMITVLDNEIVVASGANPFWHGQLPFQIYRPTKVAGEFPGIGEIEPIEDLNRELNEMRTQRRDNAVLVLNKPFAYWDGLVDPDEIRFGAGSLIPTPGDPSELIRPLDVGDIPGSGYQEEAALVSDIEKVSGIAEVVAGGESSSPSTATATGAQLIHQAASLRVQNKLRLLESELIAPTTEQFHELNKQKIRAVRSVRVPAPPDPNEPASLRIGAEQRWEWLEIGPDEMQGEFDFVAEGGSSEPDNIAQMRQDAQVLMQMFGQDPMAEHRKILIEAMRKMGLKQPESYLAPPAPQFPAMDPNKIGQILTEQYGMDPATVNEILQAGQLTAMGQNQPLSQEATMQAGVPPTGGNGAAPGEPPVG